MQYIALASVFIFVYLVESFVLTYVGTGLLNVKLSLDKLLKITFIEALIISIIRLPQVMSVIKYGIHGLLFCVLSVIVLTLVGKIRWRTSINAVLISYIILLGGSIVLGVLLHFTNDDLMHIFATPALAWKWVLYGNVEHTWLFILTALIKFKKFYLTDASKDNLSNTM